jgi:hypothetical protein
MRARVRWEVIPIPCNTVLTHFIHCERLQLRRVRQIDLQRGDRHEAALDALKSVPGPASAAAPAAPTQ